MPQNMTPDDFSILHDEAPTLADIKTGKKLATPLTTSKSLLGKRKTEMDYGIDSRSGLPKNMQLEAIYNALEGPDRVELVQTTIDKAMNEMADNIRIQDIQDLPKKRGKIPRGTTTTEPILYKSHLGGNKYQIIMSLENWGDLEDQNTLVIFNTEREKGGKFSTQLDKEKVFHMGTQEDFDTRRRNPLSGKFWTNEGMWLKGVRSTQKYKRKKNKVIEVLSDKSTNIRALGKGDEKRGWAEGYLETIGENGFEGVAVEMAAEEEAAWKIQRDKVEEARLRKVKNKEKRAAAFKFLSAQSIKLVDNILEVALTPVGGEIPKEEIPAKAKKKAKKVKNKKVK